MKILDYFFYSFKRIWLRHDEPDEEDSSMRSVGLLTIVLTFFILSVITGIGVITNSQHYLADLLANSSLYFCLLLIIVSALIILRYFRYVKYPEIASWVGSMSRAKRAFFRVLFWVFIVGTPILSFITFRLYKYGAI